LTKKGQVKPRREPTKRQLTRWQQQKRRQRLFLGLGGFVIVGVLGVIGAGWYTTQYGPLHETVIKVNDTSFDMKYYVNILDYYGKGQSSSSLYSLADGVVQVIEQNELVRQGAEALDIRVSDAEVDEELEHRDPPLSKDYRDLVRTEMLVTKLKDEYFEHQVPLFAEQCHVLAMFLESESQVNEVRSRLEAGEDFADLADELSLEPISKAGKGDLGWQTKDILDMLLGTSVLSEYALSAEVGMLSSPVYDEALTKRVGYWLVSVSERKEDSEEAHVQGILLGSDEEAQRVRDRLEAGEDFAALAEEVSQQEESKENGGDLGWLSQGMKPALDDFIFAPEIPLGTVSESIRDDTVMTTGGYWLLEVLDREENRKIEDSDRDSLKSMALQEWVSSLWDDPETKIEDYLDSSKKAWAIDKVAGELGQ